MTATISKLRPKKMKHRLRLDADNDGFFVEIFPPPSKPAPLWLFGDYDSAKSHANMLSDRFGLKVHDAIRPEFLEHIR